MIAAMTNSMLALCIAFIFSGWVWTLKHELTRMQGQLLGVGGGGGVHSPEVAAAVRGRVARPAPLPAPVVRPADGLGLPGSAKRRSDGVRVFVIEA